MGIIDMDRSPYQAMTATGDTYKVGEGRRAGCRYHRHGLRPLRGYDGRLGCTRRR